MTRWLAALLVLVLVALGSPAGFIRDADAAPALRHAARVGRVTVLAERGLEAKARDLAASAEATLARIAADLADLPTPATIEVRLVEDAADLAAIAPAGRGAPPWAVGVAYPDLAVISIALRRGGHPIDAAATLRHELAHVALGAALGPRAPHWLHEGFAYQHSAEWSRERIDTLSAMAWSGNVIPLAQLDRAFPAEELPAHRAYAQSYDFVGYLSRRGRWEDREDDGDRWPFRRFLHELGTGATLDAAAVRAFGRPMRALFEEWQHDLAQRYRLLPLGLVGFLLWLLAALLLVLAYYRRRRQNRARVAQWDRDDAERRARAEAAMRVIAPPYVPWPGEDPLDEPDDDAPRPPPRLLN